MSGKGSARRKGSSAAKYAAGWARIWRRSASKAEGGKLCGIVGGRGKANRRGWKRHG